MSGKTAVVDPSGNSQENIENWAKHLGTNKIRRKLFNAIYGRGAKPRSRRQFMKAAGIGERDSQQAQNQLDHLEKHGLIERVDNDGSVDDGSRYLYKKDRNVRAVKARIIYYADHPSAAKRLATKRNPQLRGIPPIKVVVTRQALRKKKRLNVLYLTANPDEAHSLRVDAEVSQVQSAVRGSVFRDNIALEYRPAADLNSLIDGLNDHRPQIVHFSGHGYEGGVAVDNPKARKRQIKTISFDLLAKALAATDDPPQVLVLNSCKSVGAKKAFLPPAQAMIVMRDSVSDLAATAFAAKFYAAIAAGQSLQSAFAQGKVAIAQISLNEADTPELILAKGINARKIVLA